MPEGTLRAILKQAGIEEVFGPGTSTQDIVAFINSRHAVPA